MKSNTKKLNRPNVVLVRPQNVYGYNNCPPLSLLAIGTYLKNNGVDVEIIDAAQDKYRQRLAKSLKNATMVGITSCTSEIRDAINISDFIKKKNPKMPVVWGGWHVTLFPDQVCADKSVDYAVSGEGEAKFLELVNAIYSGKKIKLEGVYPNNSNDTRSNMILEDLSAYDYDLIDKEKYIPYRDVNGRNVRQIYYESSRGCPHRCAFCINVVANNIRWRKKSAKKIVTEITEYMTKHQVNHINFFDDNFCVDKNRVIEICELILKKKLKITWFCECRADYFKKNHIDDKVFSLMRKAGLISMTIGAESGSQKMLDYIDKDITVADIVSAVTMCNKYNVIPSLSFIVGFPKETRLDVKKSLKLIKKIKKLCPRSVIAINTFRPYPRCKLTNTLVAKGILDYPASLREWTKSKYLDMFTATEYKTPWQFDADYLNNMSFYYTLASIVPTKKKFFSYMKKIWGIPFLFFIVLAKIRIELDYYYIPIDMHLYAFLRKIFRFGTA